MAREFRLPDIGEGLTEAEIVRWLVPVGEPVAADEPVVEVETDKAVVEIPSPFAGVVLFHGGAVGDVIEVGEVLVVVGDEGEVWPEADTQDEGAAEPESIEAEESGSAAEAEPEESEPDQTASEPQEPAPIVGTLSSEAEELLPRTESAGRAPGGVKALPVVRKLARERGVDLTTIAGTGTDGRITRQDVLDAVDGDEGEVVAAEPPPIPQVPEPVPATIPAGGEHPERRPLTKLRRTIAANMSRSWAEVPHVTTFDEVDATRLLAMREALSRRHETKIPIDALVMKAVSPALESFPELNATLDGDDLLVHRRQDIGIAVDTPEGLMVAVVRNAGRRSLLSISEEVHRLGAAARERKLGHEELTGQTFTISNIGAVGGGHGTPIVPPGTVAILSVGRAQDAPVVRDGRVEVAPLMPLSLSYDHRVIDGAHGRRFMAHLIENLEEPTLFLA